MEAAPNESAARHSKGVHPPILDLLQCKRTRSLSTAIMVLSRRSPSPMQTLTLNIQGMTCDHCCRKIEHNIGSLPGIHRCEVDLPSNSAQVEFDESVCTPSDLISAVQRAGFQVEGFRPAPLV